MKKLSFTIMLALCLYYEAFSQATPVGTANTIITPWNPTNSSFAWFRGGNLAGGGAGTNNIFGTGAGFNAPIYTITNGSYRSRLNGNVAYPVNGFAGARDGFFLLGPNSSVGGGSFYGTAMAGPFSLFHLNGNNPSGFAQELGYRDWMRTGITYTDNNDRAYVGYRNFAADVNDFVLNWSDNSTGPSPGPDNLVFNFTAGVGPVLPTGNLPDLSGNDVDGREIMRLTGFGNVGIGPRYNNAFQPQSTLHQHQENAASSWMQITNQFLAGGASVNPGPTAVSNADGLRLGILGSVGATQNGLGILYNQEERPLLFSTNANTNVINATLTQERMRIMNYNTPTPLFPAGYGFFNPVPGMAPNTTRVSISHDPGVPLVRPLSLLHIGYNNDFGAAFTLGHRDWMDVGSFTSQGFDNMYVGLKGEGSAHDAIINWGDATLPGGTEVMRFIFTQPGGAGTNAASTDGLEIARMWSDGTVGRTGFGDLFSLGIQPQNTVHINGIAPSPATPGGVSGLRFEDTRALVTPTISNPGTGVLAVDANGDVVYVDATSAPAANNGLSVNAAGTHVVLGQDCNDPLVPAQLLSHREIPLNAFNIYFTGQDLPSRSDIGLGWPACSPLRAKLNVLEQNTAPVAFNTIAAEFINRDVIQFPSTMCTAVSAIADHMQPSTNPSFNIGGHFIAANASTFNWAVVGRTPSTLTGSAQNVGGYFSSQSNLATANFGIRTEAFNAATNYGIYADATPTGGIVGPNYAGFFNGDLVYTGSFGFSDVRLKKDVKEISNSLDIIEKLNPVTYNYKTDEFKNIGLSRAKQYGFIAQEVETILPELTSPIVVPAKIDSMGKEISPKEEFTGLNYIGFIAILTDAIKKQQAEIEELKAVVRNPANDNNITNVTLSNAQSIILDQNVPNPFAEQTTITYTLTENVQKAQMLFYNTDGKLVNSVELKTAAGKNQLNVFASDLSSGIYSYTLVVDGKIIDTKRMVKNK